MPTKCSNAQHLVEYQKQLLYEENQKSGNVMQQPMDFCVCGINTSSESILIRSYLLSSNKHVPVEFCYTYFTRNVNRTKRENFLTSNVGMHSLLLDISRFLILFLEELLLIFNQMLSIRAFGRRVDGFSVHLYIHLSLHTILGHRIKILHPIKLQTFDP